MLLNQINQLEKDKDVVAQSQAITMLEALPQLSFSVVNALNNFLLDAQVFCLSFLTVSLSLSDSPTHPLPHTDGLGILPCHSNLFLAQDENLNFLICRERFFGESGLRRHLH